MTANPTTDRRARLVAAIKTSPFEELRTIDYSPNGPLQITIQVEALADALLPAMSSPSAARADDRPVNDMRELYAVQHAVTGAGGELTPDVHKAIDALREVWDAELRRAQAEAPLSPDYEHPDCGFHWHGRDGMDIPVRDGQPVCPRCELAAVEKKLRHSEKRREELRAECLRRGKVKLEYAEKIRLLEKQLDEVRSQLGAEILRAGQAEAELRRMADEAQQQPDTETPDAEGEQR